jgi:hypothetical protein
MRQHQHERKTRSNVEWINGYPYTRITPKPKPEPRGVEAVIARMRGTRIRKEVVV